MVSRTTSAFGSITGKMMVPEASCSKKDSTRNRLVETFGSANRLILVSEIVSQCSFESRLHRPGIIPIGRNRDMKVDQRSSFLWFQASFVDCYPLVCRNPREQAQGQKPQDTIPKRLSILAIPPFPISPRRDASRPHHICRLVHRAARWYSVLCRTGVR